MKIREVNPNELQNLVDIDDLASQVYADAGIEFDFAHDHPFLQAERNRWGTAIDKGLAWCVVSNTEQPLGFVVCAIVDGQPYLDQISVLPEHMNKRIGRNLLNHVFKWSAQRPLYLTTYGHLPWNKSWYEKFGFVEIPAERCGDGLKLILEQQRQALPDPDKRIVMLRS